MLFYTLSRKGDSLAYVRIGRIKDGHLPRKALWKAFFGTIWRSIAYALPATTLSKKEFHSLLRPFYHTLLSYLGVNQKMNRQWVYVHPQF